MQGPLAAAPGFACMDRTAVIIKYTMAIHSFHLYGIAGLAPILPGNFLPLHSEVPDHSFLIVLVKGYGGFSLAAVATLLTFKYV